MDKEAKQILAFIFKRSGKETLPASDVYLAMSMELQWCSPKEAKAFVKHSIAINLLKENNQGVTPSFQVEDVEIPTGFSPSNKCFSEITSPSTRLEEHDLLSVVISRIQGKKQMDEKEIKSSIKKIASEKMIVDEVAAVFYAKKMECAIQDLIASLKKIFLHLKKIKHNGK
jgi:hypothetical protein